MRNEYNNLDDFIRDLHELSVLKTILEMGFIEEKEIKQNGFTNCIFHDGDRTPSLQITDNYFKCYACDAKGDIIKFVQLYYNTDFIEAIRKIANFYEIKLNSLKFEFDGVASKLKSEWENYINEMNNASKEIQELRRDFFPQEIGFDKIEGYIVLPLTSKTGSILGFTKRRIDFLHEKDSEGKYSAPKWKHSSLRNSLMSQCHNVFNLYTASPEIKKKRSVILTEGPKDVIAYQRIGCKNTICCCGTTNSNNIWDLILPVDDIILSMDGDKAGIKATIEDTIYLSSIFDIKHIFSTELPDGEDPYSIKNLKPYYDNKINALDFVINYGKREHVKEIYDNVPEFNKTFVLQRICKANGYNAFEAESWLNDLMPDNVKLSNDSEKEKLLNIVNGNANLSNCNNPNDEIEKAKRMLKLKFNITI